MYIVPRIKTEIHLINDDDEVSVYEDYQEFIECTSYWFVEKHVVNNFKEWLNSWFCLFYSRREGTTRYIVRDKFGSVYTRTEILNDIYNLNYNRHRSKEPDHRFRHGPVPRTGKRNWHFGTWYKTPRTTQEKRWNCAHKEYVRGRRTKGFLPSTWDDYPRSDTFVKRSWKKCGKRKQWM